MKYLRIFLLHLQVIAVHRSRSFIWFLVPLIDAGLVLAFWFGALRANTIAGMTLSTITSYYLLLTVLSVFLTAHVEEDVSREDIRDGKLTMYLIRPISYYWIKFYEEIPFRLLQGGYGVLMLFGLYLFFGKFFLFTTNSTIVLLSTIIVLLAYFMFFTYKMIIGIITFWLIDISGFFQFQEIILAICAGYILPISLFPDVFAKIVYATPYPYMLYYPVISFQGLLSQQKLFEIITYQTLWLLAFFFMYSFLWNKGIRKYSAVGQ